MHDFKSRVFIALQFETEVLLSICVAIACSAKVLLSTPTMVYVLRLRIMTKPST